VLFELAGKGVDDPAWDDDGAPSIGDKLLRPSVIYAPAVRALLDQVEVHAVAHITGGGLAGNLERVLPADAGAVVDPGSWGPPRIFDEIQRLGSVDPAEMAKVFNLGIGMVVALPAAEAGVAIESLTSAGHAARVIGEVVAGDGTVRLAGA